MKVYFIRHGKTLGNEQGRYVGRTNELLLPESCEMLRKKQAPKVELVISSPMIRCIQTAECLYKGVETWVAEGLEEIDFGAFEYKNYEELNGKKEYQDFIESGGKTTFPGAEPLEGFKKRCVDTFLHTLQKALKRKITSVAYIVHGGTIMAILEAVGEPKRSYFDWQIKNGEILEGEWMCKEKICIKE